MSQELRAKILDYINIIILIAIIAISPWFYGSVGLPAQYLIHILSLAALLLWIVRKSIYSENFEYQPLYLPLILFFIISLISIIFSIYRYISILETLNLISYLIIFFMVAENINNEKRLRFFIWIINMVGLFYCVYGILQYYGRLPRVFWAEDYSLSSRFVNSGSFAAFINMNIFLSLGAVFSDKKIFAKTIFILFSAIFLISLILSKSRISWIIFIFTLTLFLILSFKKPNLINIRGYIFIIIFGIIIVYILLRYKALLWERIYIAVPTHFQSLCQRFDVWKGTMRIILNHPFGTGIGSFQYIYPTYRIHSDRFIVDYAHSDYLQMASELGIIGLAAFAWFIVGLLREAFRSLFKLPNHNFFMVAGLLCAALSFNFQALLDFPLHIPANAILFFTIIGLLVRYTQDEKPKAVLLNKYAKIVSVILIIIAAILFTNIYLANKYSILAKKSFLKMDWQSAILNYNKSIKLMSINADSYAGKGNIYALKAALAFMPQKIQYRKVAILDFLKATRLNSYQSDYYLSLAWLYADDGMHKEAMHAFNKAIETNPTNGEYYYSYADYCLEHNLLNEALKTYRKSLSLFINEDGRFYRLYGSIYGLFDKIYGYSQEYSQLKQAVPDGKLDVRLEFAQFLEAKGRGPEAYIEYKEILAKDPSNAYVTKAIDRLKRE